VQTCETVWLSWDVPIYDKKLSHHVPVPVIKSSLYPRSSFFIIMYVLFAPQTTTPRSIVPFDINQGFCLTLPILNRVRPGAITYNLFSPLITALVLVVSSHITSSLLLYTFLTGDLPSLITRCTHSHCPFYSLITSSLLV